ncbi:endolysin [Mycobacterium phage Kimona]|uniref:Lysin B n=1 Tax=Mycobacterium phage Kimona TaxID=2024295 RepID=A0A249XTX3_9CAUD|nr:endolysin [Mycobacterium phage Kimona]ASZ75443.1 lysin B [Mycobacterium phage Kimona]
MTRWLFTVHGTGQPDPLGPGLPADTARQVLDLYKWQPIGNYPAAPFPMWKSIMQGVEELRVQLRRVDDDDEVNLAGYSQGACVVAYVLKYDIMNPDGEFHHLLHLVRKVVFWGNPMRQQGIAHSDNWIHATAGPETHGILEDRLEGLENAPFEVRDYAHDEDMYAAVKDDDMHEYQIAIARIVMRATDWFVGENSIMHQLLELGQRPIWEGIAAAQAAIDALKFAGSTAHGYNIQPAVEFLRQI